MRVLIPLPDRDFDTTEVAVPWHELRSSGHEVVFATEGGAVPACDPKLLTGVIFGKLGADPEPIAFYGELAQAPEFRAPITGDAIEAADYDGMRQRRGRHARVRGRGRALCLGPLAGRRLPLRTSLRSAA